MKEILQDIVFAVSIIVAIILLIVLIYQSILNLRIMKRSKNNEIIIDNFTNSFDNQISYLKYYIPNLFEEIKQILDSSSIQHTDSNNDCFSKIEKLKEQNETTCNSLMALQDNYNFTKNVDGLIYDKNKQLLLQSKVQFWLSIIACIFGTLSIIILFAILKDSAWYEYIFKILPSTVIEIISTLFLSQSKDARKEATDALDKYNADKKAKESLEIAESIKNEELKSLLKCQIALSLIDEKDINIFEISDEDDNSKDNKKQ